MSTETGQLHVFWAVGVRLFIAGLRQIVQPRYTAETILGVKDPDATLIVRELGFANTAIGSAGLGSIYLAGWVLPVANWAAASTRHPHRARQWSALGAG